MLPPLLMFVTVGVIVSLISTIPQVLVNASPPPGKFEPTNPTGFYPIIYVNGDLLRLVYKCAPGSGETFIAGPYEVIFNFDDYIIKYERSPLYLYAEVTRHCPSTVLVDDDFRRLRFAFHDALNTNVEGKMVTFRRVRNTHVIPFYRRGYDFDMEAYMYKSAQFEIKFTCYEKSLTPVVAPRFKLSRKAGDMARTMVTFNPVKYDAFKKKMKQTCGIEVKPDDLTNITFATFNTAYINVRGRIEYLYAV
ncbi:hypothetical protein FOZ63_032083 [Perkinsus olseni]|uniref:Uncharacterized protein n=1 Tax=Perkinsus olseni TaxID=32597 RepID=A0A7J6SQ85_PEROL|nr:hypothetical protein FOZ60_016891 [Perkinsus olseni]KAF4734885.1 hypothetical protein FOZ63_032083 [Perkinsus olseni]